MRSFLLRRVSSWRAKSGRRRATAPRSSPRAFFFEPRTTGPRGARAPPRAPPSLPRPRRPARSTLPGDDRPDRLALAELDGLNDPNPYGQKPLVNNDPTQPNDAYFQHVDWIVSKANSLGIYVGFLPTWGDKWNQKWGVGPEVFTPANARAYGEWLGRRYADDSNIIWILGGDRPAETNSHKEITRAMARIALGLQFLCGVQQATRALERLPVGEI